MTQIETLAREFAVRLRDELTQTEWLDVILRNAAETDTGVCHSHDFCDANMVMEAAFIAVTGHEPLGDDGMSDETVTLWNAAWNYAAPRFAALVA